MLSDCVSEYIVSSDTQDSNIGEGSGSPETMNHGLGFFADKQDGCALLSG
jgi:hypothetical protein